MSSWGLKNRLARIIRPATGRTVMLAVDHGYFLGPTSGLESPAEVIAPLAPYADTLMLTRGVLRSSVDPRVDVPIVLRVSGGTSILSELSNEGLVTTMEDAVRLNAAGGRALDLRRLPLRAPDAALARGAGRRRRAARDPGARRDGGRQGHGARRPLPGAGLPHRGRAGGALRQDLLLRQLRARRAHLPGAGRDRRRQEAARERGARAGRERGARRRERRRHGAQHLPVHEPGGDDPGGARGGARGRHGGPGLRALQVAAEARGEADRGEEDGGEKDPRPRREVAARASPNPKPQTPNPKPQTPVYN